MRTWRGLGVDRRAVGRDPNAVVAAAAAADVNWEIKNILY